MRANNLVQPIAALSAFCVFASAGTAQPVLQTSYDGGIMRAAILHAGTREAVSDANPAIPGESLIAFVQGATDEISVMVDEAKVSASKMPAAPSRLRLPFRARSAHSSTERGPSAAAAGPLGALCAHAIADK